jgi:hypothetical protein
LKSSGTRSDPLLANTTERPSPLIEWGPPSLEPDALPQAF